MQSVPLGLNSEDAGLKTMNDDLASVVLLLGFIAKRILGVKTIFQIQNGSLAFGVELDNNGGMGLLHLGDDVLKSGLFVAVVLQGSGKSLNTRVHVCNVLLEGVDVEVPLFECGLQSLILLLRGLDFCLKVFELAFLALRALVQLAPTCLENLDANLGRREMVDEFVNLDAKVGVESDLLLVLSVADAQLVGKLLDVGHEQVKNLRIGSTFGNSAWKNEVEALTDELKRLANAPHDGQSVDVFALGEPKRLELDVQNLQVCSRLVGFPAESQDRVLEASTLVFPMSVSRSSKEQFAARSPELGRQGGSLSRSRRCCRDLVLTSSARVCNLLLAVKDHHVLIRLVVEVSTGAVEEDLLA